MTDNFAKECREEVKYYRGRAADAKRNGFNIARLTYVKAALINRSNARKWENA